MTTQPNAITTWLGGPPAGTGTDPYAANPMADQLEAADYVAFTETVRHCGPAPKMFEGGTRDVPNETASKVDPHWIGWLPVGVRHHAASLRSKDEVMALFERVAGTPDVVIDHPGLAAAKARLSTWSRGRQTVAAAVAPAPAESSRQPRSTRQRAMATMTTTHTPAELIAMAQRGVFLGAPGQTSLPALTGRTV